MDGSILISPRSSNILKRSALCNLVSSNFFDTGEKLVTLTPQGARMRKQLRQTSSPNPGRHRESYKATKDTQFWRDIIKQTQRNSATSPEDMYYRRNGAGLRNPSGGALAQIKKEKHRRKNLGPINEKDALLKSIAQSASSQNRAAGLLADKKDDAFERKLTQDLLNVKGIDLDGDGQIDDDELEVAKELEARQIRSNAFCRKVEAHKCPWSWFGCKWVGMSTEQRIDLLFKNVHFDVELDSLTTKLRNYTLTRSPRMEAAISPRSNERRMPTKEERRRVHEKMMYGAIEETKKLRMETAAADPLSTQPLSYREYLTAINPVTGKYTFES